MIIYRDREHLKILANKGAFENIIKGIPSEASAIEGIHLKSTWFFSSSA